MPMINHHPDSQLLQAFAAGTLAPSLSIAVSAHLELCRRCSRQVHRLEARLAESLLHGELADDEPVTDDLEAMLQQILQTPPTASPDPDDVVSPVLPVLDWQGQQILMPRALRQLLPVSWQRVGKVARARLALNEADGSRANLLAIEPGGGVPAHQHAGYELTLLLAGNMLDEHGCYQAGDFLLLQGSQTHTPVTPDGCLCYTVLDAPVQFTRGLPRLLNGFGSLLY